MTRAIEKAVKHFEGIATGAMQEFYIDEWETTIYYRPTLTWNEQAKLIDLSTQGKSSEALIETIIIRCKERDGSPMFTTADRTTLKNSVDPDVIVKIVGHLNKSASSLEEAEKN